MGLRLIVHLNDLSLLKLWKFVSEFITSTLLIETLLNETLLIEILLIEPLLIDILLIEPLLAETLLINPLLIEWQNDSLSILVLWLLDHLTLFTRNMFDMIDGNWMKSVLYSIGLGQLGGYIFQRVGRFPILSDIGRTVSDVDM
uniref:Uncharacterized protein n=1 Tax=Cacopsylla melanoneura TaxID=428564 RepID=A0A8D9BU29_9HEMI